jgi:Flp pilus assembly protein TadG
LLSFRRRSNRGQRGQSLVEFALIVPILLAFFGASVDMARVFQAWITLESATRDAAEMAASSATTDAAALTAARKTVCTQSQGLPGFQPGPGSPPSSIESCTDPVVTIVSYSCSTTAPGATTRNPIVTVTVRATLPFRTLFNYPLIVQDQTWMLGSSQSFAIVLNRGTTGTPLAC